MLIYCIPANAQYPKKRLAADFRMGLNFPQMNGTDGDHDFKIGFNIGTNVNYKIIGNFQVQTGLLVTKKGYKSSSKVTVENITGTVSVTEKWYEATANYIQMPFNIGYELYFTKNMAFNINGGLYVAYGYGNKGRIKYRGRLTTYKPNVDPVTNELEGAYEEYTFSDTRWKRPDYGLNGSVGFIYDIYTINIGYEHGLNNVTRSEVNPLKHRVYSLSLGFRF